MEERRKYSREFDGWKIYLKETSMSGPFLDEEHYQYSLVESWLEEAMLGNFANGLEKIKALAELQYYPLQKEWMRGRPLQKEEEVKEATAFWKKETGYEKKGPYYKLSWGKNTEVFYIPQETLLKVIQELTKEVESKRQDVEPKTEPMGIFRTASMGMGEEIGGDEAASYELEMVTPMESVAKDLVEVEVRPWEMKEPWEEEPMYVFHLRKKLYQMLDETGCFRYQWLFDARRQYLKAWNYDALLSFVDACFYLEKYISSKEREAKYGEPKYEEYIPMGWRGKPALLRLVPVSPDWFRYETQAPLGWEMHEFLLLCEEVWREKKKDIDEEVEKMVVTRIYGSEGWFEDERMPGYTFFWRREEGYPKLVTARHVLKR